MTSTTISVTRSTQRVVISERSPPRIVLERPIINISELGGLGGSSGDISRTFSFGDATPDLIGKVLNDLTISTCRVVIDTPFNGIGATVSVGTLSSPEMIMAQTDLLPSEVGIYESSPQMTNIVPQNFYIFITPGAGASSGSGRVFIYT
jgi:hypothetical protein